ncbi:MAG: hypothetical protein KTR31_03665 [Myxococcales bacterium]|nr:hypothetical protein [Myxococcales bacterium]
MARAAAPFAHAVVIGASIAGLVAASALARRFARVTVLERDVLSPDFVARKGVPQGQHVHNLLARGDAVLERLFPGLFAQLADRGAVRVDWSRDTRWYHHGVWKHRGPSGVESWLMGRPLLEGCVREQLLRQPQVSIRDGAAVDGLCFDPSGRTVVGVRVGDVTHEADLVVDCSGRGTAVTRWLEDAGYPAPALSTIRADVVYATRRMRPRRDPGCRVLVQVSPPPMKRSAVAFAIEDGQWMVTLFGYHGEHPPDDDAGWRAFAQRLPVDDMHRLIDDAIPLTDVVRYRFRESQWRHFEGLRRRPKRLLVLGDGVCSFNPIYGQGMTSAALQAGALWRALDRCHTDRQLDRELRRLPRAMARVANECWQAVASEDFRHSETTGDRHVAATWINWYTRRIHRLAARDAETFTRFLRVMHMEASITSLFAPSTLLKVLTRSA